MPVRHSLSKQSVWPSHGQLRVRTGIHRTLLWSLHTRILEPDPPRMPRFLILILNVFFDAIIHSLKIIWIWSLHCQVNAVLDILVELFLPFAFNNYVLRYETIFTSSLCFSFRMYVQEGFQHWRGLWPIDGSVFVSTWSAGRELRWMSLQVSHYDMLIKNNDNLRRVTKVRF